MLVLAQPTGDAAVGDEKVAHGLLQRQLQATEAVAVADRGFRRNLQDALW